MGNTVVRFLKGAATARVGLLKPNCELLVFLELHFVNISSNFKTEDSADPEYNHGGA